MTKTLTNKQRAFVAEYLIDFNATQAAIRAGYSPRTAKQMGAENLSKPYLKELIQSELDAKLMSYDEAIKRTAEIARFDMSPYIRGSGNRAYLDVEAVKSDGFGHMIRGIKTTDRSVELKMADPDAARKTIIDAHQKARLPTGKEDDPFYTRGTIFIDYGLDDDDNTD